MVEGNDAQGPDEPANVGRYLKVVRRYSEEHVRAVLSTVLKTPAEKIRTSRAVFFIWLVQHYDDKNQGGDPRQHTRDAGDMIGQ